MTITIDATAGGATANSYLSESDADAILAAQGHTTWAALNTEVKKAALISATRTLEQYNYSGSPTSTTQALRWPRGGMLSRDGNEVGSSTIPADMQYAVAELAYQFQLSNRFTEAGTEGFSRIKVASIELDIDPKTAKALAPDYVLSFISHYFKAANSFNIGVGRA